MSEDVIYSDTSPKYKGKGKIDSTADIAPGRYLATAGRNPVKPTPNGLWMTVTNAQIIIENRVGIVPEIANDCSGNKVGINQIRINPNGTTTKSNIAI